MAASTPVAIAPCGEFPNEIKEQARAFHSTLTNVKETLSPLLSTNQDVVTEELSPLDKARLDLTLLYSLNSLFWMYLCTVGEDPKQHSVRRELDRVKEYMTRAKQIADKAKAPKLVAGAAQRFVRNALWTPSDDSQKDSQEPPRKKRR
ncbi:ribosomal RNA processing 47 isoform X2 [Dermacentor variabilis]|uniref:ribosomal RNA processing 47 isoform X2 n=1 Tax=Dermacentor variabilis TaxID=34621 RepID=UPI003F5CA20F